MNTENYLSIDLAATVKKRAIKAWLVVMAVVLVWLLLIVAAPIAKANGFETFSASLYNFFRFACHQLSARSFHVEGEPFAVCSRCFGVYFGLLVGFAGYPLWRAIHDVEPLPRFWLFLSLIPISIDWGLTLFGIWENTHLSRFVTGTILGFACAIFIVPALAEVMRNLSIRQRRRA
ncbi:MAG: DUF2085 domain-containing protein [Pyrinomonadaceae bacterium]